MHGGDTEDKLMSVSRRVVRTVLVVPLLATLGAWPQALPTTADEIIFFEWNSKNYYGLWARASAPQTSPDVALTSIDRGWASLDPPPVASSNYVDFHFWAKGATRYRLWLRMKATDDSKWNDSVWVQFGD